MRSSEVAELMKEIANTDDIQPHDNFFDVGGNSFLAIELISSVSNRTGVSLSLADVIRDPTATAISQLIKESVA
jgi:phthiocerol/phenolphthiocerol synthesis type-I polyketide synthase E